ncbi:MAG: hypothetical protein ABL923_10755 [Burkholderiaceae bacterium]
MMLQNNLQKCHFARPDPDLHTAVPRNGTPQVYVSEAGAPRAPGATGTVRIDFAVPDSMLQTGNALNNSIILQPSSSAPIYNVNIHVPNGVTLPTAR